MPFDITYLENEITDQYLHDDNPRPWIIGLAVARILPCFYNLYGMLYLK